MQATARAMVCNKKGLHARAAAKLVKAAGEFQSQVKVVRLPDVTSAGATSILSLLMLAAERGVELELQAEGADAEKAVHALVALIERRFDEDE